MTTPTPSRPKSRPFRAPRSGTFFYSLVHAWTGLIHTVVHQRNMRLHMLAATLVSLVGSGIPLGLAEKVTLIFCVLIIFFAEILNSALEQLVDLATEALNERARLAKDAAAAGVLVLAIGTVVIFAALLVHNADTIAAHVTEIRRQVALGVPYVLCIGTLIQRTAKLTVLDGALLMLALVLFALLLQRSESYVFSAMGFGLLIVASAARVHSAKEHARNQPA